MKMTHNILLLGYSKKRQSICFLKEQSLRQTKKAPSVSFVQSYSRSKKNNRVFQTITPNKISFSQVRYTITSKRNQGDLLLKIKALFKELISKVSNQPWIIESETSFLRIITPINRKRKRQMKQIKRSSRYPRFQSWGNQILLFQH